MTQLLIKASQHRRRTSRPSIALQADRKTYRQQQ